MSSKDFKKGMKAGSRPFEDLYQNMSNKMDEFYKNINEKIEGDFYYQDQINDNFDGRLNDFEKKRVYNQYTPYDIKDDDILNEDEREGLVAYLFTLSQRSGQSNENQQHFLRSVRKYLDVYSSYETISLDYPEEYIGKIEGQQAFLQVVEEYLFLGYEDTSFDFLDDYEEIIDCFNVNGKRRREIKNNIISVYQAVGAEGIAEKYGFVPKENSSGREMTEVTNTTEVEEPKWYDGSDISEACARVVGDNQYIELDDYILYQCFPFNRDDLDRPELILVSKETGEEIKTKINPSDFISDEEIDDYTYNNGYFNFGFDICGYGEYCFFLPIRGTKVDYLYQFNVNTLKVEKLNFFINNLKLYGRLQCNDDYVLCDIAKPDGSGSNDIFCYDINAKEIINISKPEGCDYISDYFLAGKYIIIEYNTMSGGSNYVRYDLEEKEFIIIDRDPDHDRHMYLSPANCYYYKGLVYGFSNTTRGNPCKINFIDVEHPMSIQQTSISNYGDIYILSGSTFLSNTKYGKVYYLTLDSSMELWCYDILTRENKMVKKTQNVVRKVNDGIFRTKWVYKGPNNANIVGNWLIHNGGQIMSLLD